MIFEWERMFFEMMMIVEVLVFVGYLIGIFGKWYLGDESVY